MNQVTALAGILLLATLTESLVEYLIAPVADGLKESKPWHTLILRYIAALVGIALCAVYRADLLAMLGLVSPWPWVGWVVTGFIIGRGANFVHDFASRWLSNPAR
jgi:hypothetical protein